MRSRRRWPGGSVLGVTPPGWHRVGVGFAAAGPPLPSALPLPSSLRLRWRRVGLLVVGLLVAGYAAHRITR